MTTQIINYLQQQIELYRRLSAETHSHLTKKNIHQLRIVTRRLRGVVWLIEHCSKKNSFKSLKFQLKSLAKMLGQMRELDVAIADAKKYKLSYKKLKEYRNHLEAKTTLELDERHRQKLLASLNKFLLHLKNSKVRLGPALLILQKNIKYWKNKNKISQSELHQLRITTKKTRYVLEVIGLQTKPLKVLQDKIGKGHDLQRLQEYTKKRDVIKADMKKYYHRARALAPFAIDFTLKQIDDFKR